MELDLLVILRGDSSFQVFRSMDIPGRWRYSVFIVEDYKHVPWPRKEGNLLW